MHNFWKKYVSIGLILLVSNIHFAQDTTAVVSFQSKKAKSIKRWITPVALITSALFIHETKGSFSKHRIQDNVQDNFAINSKTDDYLQYGPYAFFIILKTLGKEGKNSGKDQFFLLGKSQLLMAGTVYFLKVKTRTPRPSGAAGRRSFPSGHTSMCFAAASFLSKEYRDTNKALVWSGYGLASITGAMRVMNNKHWVSDILLGAGIGILSTELVYLHHNRTRKNKSKYSSLSLLPEVGKQHFGFSMNYKL